MAEEKDLVVLIAQVVVRKSGAESARKELEKVVRDLEIASHKASSAVFEAQEIWGPLPRTVGEGAFQGHLAAMKDLYVDPGSPNDQDY